jgi:hypothetical protein
MADEKKLTPQEELASLQAEETRLRVEMMRDQVQAARQKKEMFAHQAKVHQADQKAALDRVKRSQASCKHRKGGLGVDGFVTGNGNDNNYSVAVNTYPWQETVVQCLRCGKEWHPPNCKCNPKRPSTLEEYNEARRFPTDNSPSTAVTFDNTYAPVAV